MGRLIVEQIISADGFAADVDGGLDWFGAPDMDREQVDHDQLRMLESVDAILLGATTYRMFAQFWPAVSAADDPVAGPINLLPKHVVSSTLGEAPWGSHPAASIERGDPIEIAARLTARYEGDVIVWGSLQLAEALLGAGAVDTLRLRIAPVLIGSGRPFASSVSTRVLRLKRSVSMPSGHVTNTYEVGSEVGAGRPAAA